jgi:hypothetical protein
MVDDVDIHALPSLELFFPGGFHDRLGILCKCCSRHACCYDEQWNDVHLAHDLDPLQSLSTGLIIVGQKAQSLGPIYSAIFLCILP